MSAGGEEDPGSEFLQVMTGTYYRMVPKQSSPFASHVFSVGKPVFLPVLDTVSTNFQHTWSEADNLVKNAAASVGKFIGGSGVVNFVSGVLGAANTAASFLGGGAHISACKVFSDSAPGTMTVRTKLFSPNGDGKLLELIEKFRGDFHSTLAKGGKAGIGGSQLQGGLVSHPGWWDIEIISFAGGGASVIASFPDCHCVSMGTTFYSPYIGKDPSIVDLEMTFVQSFRGLRENSAFGKSVV